MSLFIIFLLYAVFCAVTGAFLATITQDIPRHYRHPMARDTRPQSMATRKDVFHARDEQ